MCKGLFRLLVSCQILFLVIPDVLPFNPNTPEFVANRRKMLDLVVFNDKCNELNYLSRAIEPARRWHKIINPQKYRRAQSKLSKWNATLSVGDTACEEALYLWTTLPGDEIAECAGAIKPMCQKHPETGYVCGVYWHDADRINPPLRVPFKYCLQKSLEVDAAFRKEEGSDGAGRSPGHQRRNSPSRGSKNSDMSGKDSERTRKNAEAYQQESSRSSNSEEEYSSMTQYSDDSSSSQRSKSSSGTNSQRSKRSNGRESQRSRSRKREDFEAERRAVAVAAAIAAIDARLKKEEKADKMRNKQKMVQDGMDSDGEKSWGTGGDGDLNTGNSHQHDVRSPVRDSPRVRKRGRATSSPNSSPNRAFNGNSLNVKLNKYYPGDVSVEP